jgi:hypothetical protein
MSIVRIGLGETKGDFAEGYEAIFGKKDDKKSDASKAQDEQSKAEEKKEEQK